MNVAYSSHYNHFWNPTHTDVLKHRRIIQIRFLRFFARTPDAMFVSCQIINEGSLLSASRNDISLLLKHQTPAAERIVEQPRPQSSPEYSSVFSRTCEGQNIKYRTCSNAVSRANSSLCNGCQESVQVVVVDVEWRSKLWRRGSETRRRELSSATTITCPSYITSSQIHAFQKVSRERFFLPFPAGLSSRCRWFPCPAVFGPRGRAIPGSVPRVAAGLQRPREPLCSQMQSQRLGPCGGAGPQSAGRNTLLHRVLGHVHQWDLPGERARERERGRKKESFIILPREEFIFISFSFITCGNHKNFTKFQLPGKLI